MMAWIEFLLHLGAAVCFVCSGVHFEQGKNFTAYLVFLTAGSILVATAANL